MGNLLRVVAVAAALAAAWMPAFAAAHEERPVGPVTLTVGWDTEPAFTGQMNAVGVSVQRGGAPMRGADLEAVVIFGERDSITRSPPMDLQPAFGEPGHYTAAILPSRPGTYTFHITGTAGATSIDQFFTSGEQTFDDIRDASVVSFPARIASAAQLSQRIERAETKVDDLQPARSRSTIALVVGVLGALIGIVALVRRR